jgi:hypothetical protein
MASITESVRAYEARLRKALGRELVAKDLARKHEKMAASPFAFLRGTYWRWAETILEVCPDLGGAAPVLAVGDIHLENFGTWRDVDGRLVWGVNDFDEAAEMPYALDLVRLAASALLASPDRGQGRGISAATICSAILEGYAHGLEVPQAIVLDRDWGWLREALVVSDKARAKFWSKIEAAKPEPAPPHYRRSLAAAMPQPRLDMLTARRTAGTGSLGRPRWVARAEWRGAPVVRELKVMLPSAWHREPGEQAIRCAEIAGGRFRANDPWYRLDGNLLVRRLSPNNRKIEAEAENGGVSLLTPEMLRAMGLDLASVHLGTGNRRAAVARDLARRKDDWLRVNAQLAAAAVARDHADWKASA